MEDPKKAKTKKISYDPHNLKLALEEIRNSEKPDYRKTAQKYSVPKSTLHYRHKHPDVKTTFGPPPVLSTSEEILLKVWVKESMRKGFPLKIEDLQQSVFKFLQENPRPNPFKDNFPGVGWAKAFLRRHPDIVSRTSEGVTQSSACVSETDIRKWFYEIHLYFAEKNIMNVFDDPSRIFNGDESGFQLCPKTGKVLAIKGTKNVNNIDQNNSKESITVMFTFSAAGEACPPMVVYNYQRIPQRVVEGIPDSWGVGRSESGWMTSELFFEYIANIFHPHLVTRGIKLPVIYFLDGHRTHLTYQVSKLCTELGIEVVALYPNATRILQPADVAVFRPVKAAWKDASRSWLLDNPGEQITKVNFAKILEIALKKSLKPATLINGFRVCGLVPFNPDAVDYSKCMGVKSQEIPVVAQQNQDANQYSNHLTFSVFSEIVGPRKMEELQKPEETNRGTDENFRILRRLYELFSHSSSLELDSANIEKTYSAASPSILESEVSVLNEQEFSPKPSLEQAPALPMDVDMIIDEKAEAIPEMQYTAPTQSTPIKQTISTNNTKATDSQNLPKKSPAFKIISNVLLGNYLTLPKTPERKGKKNTIRYPYAITSDKYKAMFKEQLEKKDLTLKLKEERKKSREQSKLKKEIKKTQNKKTKEKSTNTCKTCSTETKTSNRLVCDLCSSIFHVRCVPAYFKHHVPEDITIDLYVCHFCYKEDNNEDSGSLEDFNDNDYEDGEDSQTDRIFALINEQQKAVCF